MDKTCPEHGAFSAQLATNAAHYYLHDPKLDTAGSCCGPGQHCGDQVANHSCNMLIEITQRCNLTCPTCYASSSPDHHEFMTLERFRDLVDDLLAKGKGSADLIQLSGGEPTLHPELGPMIDYALERGVRQVYINTNGIKLSPPGLCGATRRLRRSGLGIPAVRWSATLHPRSAEGPCGSGADQAHGAAPL